MQTNNGSATSIAERTAGLSGGINRSDEQQQQHERIDFKMVTFSLGGKDYGIDIMKVKEIAKFRSFTYVPNTPEFVRGVYNLRGDIISIIDLRSMFNLSFQEVADGEPHDGLIIRLENNMLGVIVDSIARVVGISRKSIQPPHPIFADINLKYIEGVVEYNERLYIILDVERIFAKEDRESGSAKSVSDAMTPQPEREPVPTTGSDVAPSEPTKQQEQQEQSRPAANDTSSVSFDFIRETLATFADFHVTPVNEDWVRTRLEEWTRERESRQKSVQFESAEDARSFLSTFYSPDTGRFWSKSLVDTVSSLLPQSPPGSFYVWNAGCGGGYETYSLAALLVSQFPEARIKVWAHDKDLLQVSSAPNLVFQESTVPQEFREFVVHGSNGSSFSSEIKDRIVFEYHDVLHANALPAVDMVIARDLISFLEPAQQTSFIQHAVEKMKPGGIMIAGQHERLDHIDRLEEIQPRVAGVYQVR